MLILYNFCKTKVVINGTLWHKFCDYSCEQYLTVENVREMLQLSIQLCKARSSINNTSSNSGGFGSSYYSSILGGSAPSTLPPGAANIAVASTAFATV
jgi:hypothetical protein